MMLSHPLWDREMRSWLLSPGQYLMGAAFLFLTGVGFWVSLLTLPGRGLLASEVTFGGVLFWMAVVAMASVCGVRALGEEQERGTMELLLTAPVDEADIVLVKFGTTVAWVMLLCCPAVSYPWLLNLVTGGTGGMDPGAWAAGMVILLLGVGLVTALGMLCSQLFRRSSPAVLVTFVLAGMVVFRGAMRSWMGTSGAGAGEGLTAVGSHVAVFATGMVDSRALVFYVTAIAALLFLNVRILQMTRCRRASSIANVVTAMVLVTAVALMVNYISMRHGVKWDWTTGGSGLLSPKTVQMLRGVDVPGKVTLVARAGDPFVPAARRLLAQYERLAPSLRVAFVDPDVEIGRTRDLVGQYALQASGALIVEFGKRRQVLYLAGLAAKGGSAKASHLRGGVFVGAMEQKLTSAIHVLSQEKVPVVYFLGGHGERRPDDFTDYVGYSEIAGAIRESPADVRSLKLAMPAEIARDCSLLVIAGPSLPLSPWEVGRIRDYLAGGGRVLMLADAGKTTGMESLLMEWSIRTGPGYVVEPGGWTVVPLDKGRSASGMGETPITTYGRHPITVGVERLATTLTLPCPVEPAAEGVSGHSGDQIDRPQVTPVALTSPRSWVETDMDRQPPQFNEGLDRSGPVSVAVAAEMAGRSAIKMDIRPVRLVVIGDSQFAANRCLAGGNRPLFMNAVDWLLERESGAGAGTAGRGLFDVKLKPADRWPVFLATAVWWPVVMLSLAVVVGLARRDRRAPPDAAEGGRG